MTKEITGLFVDQDPGSYTCWFYETEEDQHAVSGSFLDVGLERGEKVLILGTWPFCHWLQIHAAEFQPTAQPNKAIDQVYAYLLSGSLAGQPEVLNPYDLIPLLQAEIRQAHADGYPVLRVLAEMDVILHGVHDTEKLLEFGIQLGRLINQSPCSVLWLFNTNQVDPGLALALLSTQPRIGLGQKLYPSSFAVPLEGFGKDINLSSGLLRHIESLFARWQANDLNDQNASWHHQIFDAQYEYVSVLKPDGSLIEINQSALDIYGMKRLEVIGQPAWELPAWNYRAEVQEGLQSAIAQAARGEFVRYEVDILAEKNTIRTIDFSLKPVFNQQGEVRMLLTEGRDVTPWKIIEAQLHKREQAIETILGNTPIVMFTLSADGRLDFITGKGASGILSTLATSPIGHNLFEAEHSHPEIVRLVQRALKGEAFRASIEYAGYVYDAVFEPEFDEKGAVRLVMGVATDITRSQRAEADLYESESRLRSIFDKSEVGIALFDLERHLLECNPAFQEILGYSKEELLKMSAVEYSLPEDFDQYHAQYHDLIQGQRDSFRADRHFLRKDGQQIDCHLIAMLMRRPDGSSNGILEMIEDVTVKNQLEAELIEVQHRLMQNRELERLHIAQDLHDGPLQDAYGILFELSEYLETNSDPTTHEQLLSLREKLQQQVKSLRSFCSELRPPALVQFGLEKAILSHAENLQIKHPELVIELNLVPDGEDLPDATRLALFRIYQELLNNVLRHADATRIKVDLRLGENSACLEIEDNGKGFTVPSRWIEMVRQGHFGLAGAQERAQAVGGSLTVLSSPGEGTLVRVIVPIPNTI